MTDSSCSWENLLKRVHSSEKKTEKMFINNRVKKCKSVITGHIQQDDAEKDNQYGYGKSYLYILPRKISIYAPHFKYGPNRRYSEDDSDGTDGREEQGPNGEPCDSELEKSNEKQTELEEESPSGGQLFEDNLKDNHTADPKKPPQTA